MKKILIPFIITALFFSCKNEKQELKKNTEPDEVVILVSKDPNNKFKDWLHTYTDTSTTIFTNMYAVNSEDSVNMMLSRADGIIISGGEDVYPGLYEQEHDTIRCGSIDRHRDSLDIQMISYAFQNKIPLLGVCRGHQILNVAQGGSLIVDIPEDFGSPRMHRNNGGTTHRVYIKKNTYLHSIVKVDSGDIYSNHHQGINILAEGLSICSRAPDSLIEAVELSDTTQHPFVLGVQWHPEIMEISSPLSGTIGVEFIKKVNAYNEKEILK